MTPGASDQAEQRDDLTEKMRLENRSELARGMFTLQAWSAQPCVWPVGCGSHDRWP
jgi:hypothetical protein